MPDTESVVRSAASNGAERGATPLRLAERRTPSPASSLRARSGNVVPSRGALGVAGPMHETELSRAYRQIAATLVERLVAMAMGVSVDALHARTRSCAQVAFARQVAMYLANTAFCISQTEVGQRFGRDRTTVKHACARVEDRRDDPAFEARLTAMEAMLEEARYAMQLFAMQADTIGERVLVEIGALPNSVEDRR